MFKDMKFEDLVGEDFDILDSNKICMIKLQQFECEKNMVVEKFCIIGKCFDYLECVFRKEEVKKFFEDFVKQCECDFKVYELIKV